MAIITIEFTPGNHLYNLNLEVSKRYEIQRLRINFLAYDNLRHVLDNTQIYYCGRAEEVTPIETRTISLRELIIPRNELCIEVRMEERIEVGENCTNATISIIPNVLPPITSLVMDLEDFT